MRMTSTERVTLQRQRKKLGRRPVTVVVSEREIAYLLAHTSCRGKTSGAIGPAVSQFLSDTALFRGE